MKIKNHSVDFSVVPDNGSASFGLPDNKLLDILSIRCNILNRPQGCREINAQQTEATCNMNKDSNSNTNDAISDKHNCNVDYFLLRPGRESDKRGGAKVTEGT